MDLSKYKAKYETEIMFNGLMLVSLKNHNEGNWVKQLSYWNYIGKSKYSSAAVYEYIFQHSTEESKYELLLLIQSLLSRFLISNAATNIAASTLLFLKNINFRKMESLLKGKKINSFVSAICNITDCLLVRYVSLPSFHKMEIINLLRDVVSLRILPMGATVRYNRALFVTFPSVRPCPTFKLKSEEMKGKVINVIIEKIIRDQLITSEKQELITKLCVHLDGIIYKSLKCHSIPFGGLANGFATNNSDIDLLIRMSDESINGWIERASLLKSLKFPDITYNQFDSSFNTTRKLQKALKKRERIKKRVTENEVDKEEMDKTIKSLNDDINFLFETIKTINNREHRFDYRSCLYNSDKENLAIQDYINDNLDLHSHLEALLSEGLEKPAKLRYHLSKWAWLKGEGRRSGVIWVMRYLATVFGSLGWSVECVEGANTPVLRLRACISKDGDILSLPGKNPNYHIPYYRRELYEKSLEELKVIQEKVEKGESIDQFILDNIVDVRTYFQKYHYKGLCHVFKVDITLGSDMVIYNSRLLRSYASFNKHILALGVFVKNWTRNRDISDASCGYLSSYAWILIVIHFFQYCLYSNLGTGYTPIAPNLQNIPEQIKEDFREKKFKKNEKIITLENNLEDAKKVDSNSSSDSSDCYGVVPQDILPIEYEMSEFCEISADGRSLSESELTVNLEGSANFYPQKLRNWCNGYDVTFYDPLHGLSSPIGSECYKGYDLWPEEVLKMPDYIQTVLEPTKFKDTTLSETVLFRRQLMLNNANVAKYCVDKNNQKNLKHLNDCVTYLKNFDKNALLPYEILDSFFYFLAYQFNYYSLVFAINRTPAFPLRKCRLFAGKAKAYRRKRFRIHDDQYGINLHTLLKRKNICVLDPFEIGRTLSPTSQQACSTITVEIQRAAELMDQLRNGNQDYNRVNDIIQTIVEKKSKKNDSNFDYHQLKRNALNEGKYHFAESQQLVRDTKLYCNCENTHQGEDIKKTRDIQMKKDEILENYHLINTCINNGWREIQNNHFSVCPNCSYITIKGSTSYFKAGK